MVYDNILEAIGHTPMVRLRRLPDPEGAEVLVKYEGLNVGGSIKTRTAYNMILAAEKAGQIGPDTVIVEPTSGNQGIGLALVGAVRGYRTVIIMPDSVSAERRLLVEQYGAEVRLVHDAGNIGDAIDECIRLAKEMQEQDPITPWCTSITPPRRFWSRWRDLSTASAPAWAPAAPSPASGRP